jgi:predicted nucleic acid binding AN1-type Zn finger protein
MEQCAHCGAETNHAFRCNYCNQSHCSEHRLPEKHECSMHIPGNDPSSFGGEGPQTRDRRSTHRKRIERVREKRSDKHRPRPDDSLTESRRPRSKGDYRETADSEALTCPTCESGTDEIFECEDCSQKVCPSCEGRWEHECPEAVTKDADTEESDSSSLVKRLFRMFR